MEVRYQDNLKKQEKIISELKNSNISQSTRITQLLSNVVSIFCKFKSTFKNYLKF